MATIYWTKHYDVNYEGKHEAIIPRDQWEKVQQMMSTNAGHGYHPETHISGTLNKSLRSLPYTVGI